MVYSEHKCMVYDLYSLTSSLKLCGPLDIIDTRYFNQTHTSLIDPLKKRT